MGRGTRAEELKQNAGATGSKATNRTNDQTEKGIMPEQNVDQSTQPSLPERRPRTRRVRWLGVALLAALALATVTANYLAPKVPGRAEGVPARLSWYLHHDQLQADAHSFACAIQYLLASDDEMPTAATNPAVARTETSSPPKS